MPADPSTFQPNYEHSFYPGQVFWSVGPTPTDVIDEIERLVDAGVSHFPLAFDDLHDLRRFIDEVVPHVRLEPKP
jgi:alkanesulfonate monooxygenase SsuD/methylene tetrahydromethanopterin reductase-like flavin-dependent oxidoreductase (luciferase family)